MGRYLKGLGPGCPRELNPVVTTELWGRCYLAPFRVALTFFIFFALTGTPSMVAMSTPRPKCCFLNLTLLRFLGGLGRQRSLCSSAMGTATASAISNIPIDSLPPAQRVQLINRPILAPTVPLPVWKAYTGQET